MDPKKDTDADSVQQGAADTPLESDIEFVLDAGDCKPPPLGEVAEEGGIYLDHGEPTPRTKIIPSLKDIFQGLVHQERGARKQRIRSTSWHLVCFLIFVALAAVVAQLALQAARRYAFANNPANFTERKQSILGGAAFIVQRVQKYPYKDAKTLVEPLWKLSITGESDEVLEVQLLDADGRNASGGVWEFDGREPKQLKPFRYHPTAEQWLFSFKDGVRQQLVPVMHPWDRQRRAGK